MADGRTDRHTHDDVCANNVNASISIVGIPYKLSQMVRVARPPKVLDALLSLKLSFLSVLTV